MGRSNAHMIVASTERNGNFTIAKVLMTHEFEKEKELEVAPGTRKMVKVRAIKTYTGSGATMKAHLDKEAVHIGEALALSRALKQMAQNVAKDAYDEIHKRCAAQEDDLFHLRHISDETLDGMVEDIKTVKAEREAKRKKAAKVKAKAIAEYNMANGNSVVVEPEPKLKMKAGE